MMSPARALPADAITMAAVETASQNLSGGSLAVLLRSACFGEAYRLTWGLESSSRLFEHR